MRIVFHTNCISPHRLPFANAMANAVGQDNYLYIYDEPLDDERVRLGWRCESRKWLRNLNDNYDTMIMEMLHADIFCSSLRDVDIFEARAKSGLKSFYTSERWFKPLFGFPGWLRMLSPIYFKKAKRISKLLLSGGLIYFPVGVWAAKDMLRICEFFKGKIWRSFIGIEVSYEGCPLGRVWHRGETINYMRMWGYFIMSRCEMVRKAKICIGSPRRLLWVGRFLDLKRVDDILHAIHLCIKKKVLAAQDLILNLYGSGPEKEKLARLIRTLNLQGVVSIYPPVPIDEVRNLMKEHDFYVFSSDSREGWGAVVGEALEEGMHVIGTYEAGASATLLPEANLYHAGDWRRLAMLIKNGVQSVDVSAWQPRTVVKKLLKRVERGF